MRLRLQPVRPQNIGTKPRDLIQGSILPPPSPNLAPRPLKTRSPRQYQKPLFIRRFGLRGTGEETRTSTHSLRTRRTRGTTTRAIFFTISITTRSSLPLSPGILLCLRGKLSLLLPPLRPHILRLAPPLPSIRLSIHPPIRPPGLSLLFSPPIQGDSYKRQATRSRRPSTSSRWTPRSCTLSPPKIEGKEGDGTA